jgi:hypothetical protein
MVENRYVNYSDIPSDEPCWLVNSRLWTQFCQAYERREGKTPSEQWSEAEVTQYLDYLEYELDSEIILDRV